MSVSEDIRNSYQTSDGGFVPEFDGTVREAAFCFKNEYQSGEACLLELLVEPSEEDAPEFGDYLEDGLFSIIYTCGKGWEPADKGATAQHESGRARKFNSGSGMGLLLNSALELDGVEDVLMERGPATQADVWVGMKFRIEDKAFEGKNNDGEKITYTRRLPTEFHGLDEGAEPKKAPAKKAPAKKAAPAKVEAADEGDMHVISPKLKGQLRAVAVSAEDHDSFMEEAFATLELDDNAEAAIADEAFFLSLKAG